MCVVFWLETLKGRDHSEDLGINRRIILWILRKYGGKMWTGCIWLGKGLVAGCCEHCNEPSGSIKAGSFLT
jgi:hypothetical protein